MKRLLPGLVALSLLVSALLASPQKPKAPSSKGYPAVAAIFKKQCLPCHGGDDPSGGYDVSTYAGVMAASKHGKMVIPGKPDESPLVQYLRGIRKPAMPIQPADLKVVCDWIAKGAKNR